MKSFKETLEKIQQKTLAPAVKFSFIASILTTIMSVFFIPFSIYQNEPTHITIAFIASPIFCWWAYFTVKKIKTQKQMQESE